MPPPPIQRYFYPSQTGFTCPNDKWGERVSA